MPRRLCKNEQRRLCLRRHRILSLEHQCENHMGVLSFLRIKENSRLQVKKLKIIDFMKQVIEFRHQYSESLLEGTFEAFTMPSQTEPENSLSIPEIIAKFTRGLPAEIRQYQWSSGVAVPEDGETFADDGSLEVVLEVPKSEPEPKLDSEPDPEPHEPEPLS